MDEHVLVNRLIKKEEEESNHYSIGLISFSYLLKYMI